MRQPSRVRLALAAALAGCLALARLPAGPADPVPDKTAAKKELRRPVALVLADGGRWLFAANRCGSVTAIDTAARRPVAETPAGRRLADLAAAADGRLLAVDEDAGELVVLGRTGPDLQV